MMMEIPPQERGLDRANNPSDSDDDNAQLPFRLTISEYEEVARRHESSLKMLVDLV